MSPSHTEQNSHPDDLLPWFVNGTLLEEERRDVALHLESCHQCQQEIALLQQIQTQVKEIPIQSPGEFGLNRLLQDIHNEGMKSSTLTSVRPGWWKTGLAIAASLIIFIQAGLLIDVWFLSKPFAPLSGPQHHGPLLQISFAPTATASQIHQTLRTIQGSIIDGPSSLGIYRVRLNLALSDTQQLGLTIEQLRQETSIIQHVAID